ncbi:MAG: ribonuclease H-like domain-containing protein, partial [Myxococcales bacterium]|nr:ribonuclease H-like domain-containing protein [Myxococcales bacterium]
RTAPEQESANARASTLDALRTAIRDMESREERRTRRAATLNETPEPLPGRCEETPHGPLHIVETALEPHHAHGRVPVARLLEARPETLAKLALDDRIATVDPRRVLFLDLETTGLHGGTGTLPFLIGVAWFEDESLRLEQLVLPRPGGEGPMLRFLRDRIARASGVVTFNGKSFDWPLVRTRYVMNRLVPPELPPHLDVLHCARRVWKRRIGETRLVTLEREVLGHYREDDVPSASIPTVYLEYLRTGRLGRLAGVIEHNGHDLVAMAAILARLAELFDAGAEEHDEPLDLLALAEVAVRAKDPERALALSRASAEADAQGATGAAALLLHARVLRRAGDIEGEGNALDRALALAEAGSSLASTIHTELAKHHEHRTKNLHRALTHARAAVAQTGAPDDDSVRRVERLVERVERTGIGSRPSAPRA